MTTDTSKIFRSVAVGAVAGLAGAWAMNQFQALLSGISKADEQPQQQAPAQEEDDTTIKTANAISETVFHHKLSSDEKQWAGPAVHYGFGASVGAVYGVLAETFPISTSGLGSAYGTAVWALADELAVPAFGLSKPIPESPASSHLNALVSHWVYGIATDLARRGLLKLTA